MAARNDRKAQAVYWTIAEFGPYLCCEWCWFTLTLMRSKECKKLKANLSSLVAMAAEVFWPEDRKRCMKTSGILLTLYSGEVVHIFLETGFMVQDELAHHLTYMSMGVNGLKACLICCNCFNGDVLLHV